MKDSLPMLDIQNLQAEIDAFIPEIVNASISDEQLAIVKKLLNIIERLASENETLSAEQQLLRDEINRLKGEQGKPNIKANKKKDGDISSESERKEAEINAKNSLEEGVTKNAKGKNKRQRDAKLPKIKIDFEQICPLDKVGLPYDLVFKGYKEVVIQDLIIKTKNVKYLREVYYSLSEGKCYYGKLPKEEEGQGEFGSGIRALIPILKAECGLSEQRILGFFQNFDIVISAAYVSQQWTNGYDIFHQEKSDLYRSGITYSDYTQIDDTSARVDGINQYCQVVCSPLFTAYFTTPNKDRQTVLSVLNDFAPPQYLYNQHARVLLNDFKLSEKALAAIDKELPNDVVMNETEFKAQLSCLGLGIRQAVHLSEACAISFYQQQAEFPIIKILLADDAPQFKLLTELLALCWIHDGRHYKKLSPFISIHQEALDNFLSEYWAYYAELLKYRLEPTDEKKDVLSKRFDELFSTVVCYEDLNDRIAKTFAKKAELLRVLDTPKLPLHNNASELGARVQARYRDISYQTRSENGTKIKDTFMTINQTCKKLGVSFYEYVYDRVTGRFTLPSLADLIAQRAYAFQA